ncbi:MULTISPECIES: hypothetical protein [unclassified Streptomyces]|uniref:hypothetical protein n=1 Tax=unclassified Streptomyces TaxID=2593676 RepID=UPI0038112DDD
MVTFAKCEQEADDILAECLGDEAFHRRLVNSITAWGWEFPSSVRRVRVLVAMALFAAYSAREEQTPAEAAATALRILGKGDDVALFGALPGPAELGQSAALVQWLRLISIGLTGPSAHRWVRLTATAHSVLNPEMRTRYEWLLITSVQKGTRHRGPGGGGISGQVTVRLEDPAPDGPPDGPADGSGSRTHRARDPEASGSEQAVEE